MPKAKRSKSLTARDVATLRSRLKRANNALARACPGERSDRQPVHTVYGGAQIFTADVARKLGAEALAALASHAPDAATFAKVIGLTDSALAATVYNRMIEKLRREPVEDYRIDFEDGYGHRPDAEEDSDAERCADQVAEGAGHGVLPAFIGIRIKPLSNELHARSLRTLDVFVTRLARQSRNRLPSPLIVTIPKVMIPQHVSVVAAACTALERQLKLPARTITLEVMIETPQSVIAIGGSSAFRRLVAAGGGRVTATHLGTYDYTALTGITAAWQHMRHSVCDFAKHVMQVSLAQTGIWLSDGSTNVVPVGDRKTVHAAWKRHFDDVTYSLVNGYYQGWDLHPAQLPTRYAAIYAFYLSARPAATARLRAFVDKATQATLVGEVFDDAATGQALLNFFVRGLNSRALTLDEARETGLTEVELQGRSFLEVLARRAS